MENRRHKRVACDIPVILQFGLAQSLGGRVVNYCAGGALLALDVNVTELAAEQQLNLFSAFDISFTGSDKQSLVLQAHIRRMEGLSLGVEFYQPSPNTLALIDQQIRGNTPAKAATTSLMTEIQPNAAELAKRVDEFREQFWQDLLKQFFETVKSRFINLAERS